MSFKKSLRWLDINFEPLVIMILFLAMGTLITVQVIRRFIFGSGFAWGEEFAVFMFAWIAFLGISYAFRNNRQISVDFLRNMLPEKPRKILVLIVEVAMLILIGLLFRSALRNVQAVAFYGDKAQSVPITLNVLFLSAVVGFGLSFFRILQSVVWKIKRFNASYELFLNRAGLYSGAGEICFMPRYYRDEINEKRDKKLLKEEETKSYKKQGGEPR